MASGKLTALKVKSLKEPGRYGDGNGLALLVKKSCARSWVLRVQVDGKRRDFGLGSANDVGLAEAREKADEIRKMYRGGVDPMAAKQADRASRSETPTFADAAKATHAEQKGGWKNAKHSAQWLSSLQTYAFPTIGRLRVDEIDGPIVRDLLAQIWLSKPETARRVRQRIGSVLDWAYAKGYRDAEAPMKAISRGLPRQPRNDNHFAALAYEDAPAFMTQLAKKQSIGRLALRFLILTAARSGEVRGATWQEIDREAGLWTIPGERMKAGKEHIVPLPPAALQIVDYMAETVGDRAESLVFPGQNGKPMSDMTLTKVVRDGFDGKVTVHGFRSTFRDWAAERTDIAGDVVEAALAHSVQNKVEAAYRRTNYLEKRWGLMRAWGSFLDSRVARGQER